MHFTLELNIITYLKKLMKMIFFHFKNKFQEKQKELIIKLCSDDFKYE